MRWERTGMRIAENDCPRGRNEGGMEIVPYYGGH